MRKRYFYVTGFILFILVFLYFATNSPVVYTVFANLANKPIYRFTTTNEVCLVTAYDGDAKVLQERLSTLSQSNVNITVYVSADWATAHADVIAAALQQGHEFALLGPDYAQQEMTLDTLASQVQSFQEASAQTVSSFMPYSGEYTQELCAKLKEIHLPMVLWSKDSRAFSSQTEQAFIEEMIDKMHPGDIVYFVLNERFCNAIPQIASAIHEKDCQFITIKDALEN